MRSQEFSRSRRVADQLGRELATIMLEDLDDPRVRGVTVSSVEVSPDLRNATVFVNLPSGADIPDTLRALTRASGRLRRRLSARVRLKYMPSLRFQHDPTLDRVDRIERLLRGEVEGET
jgi:ribosome-binding factor A